ncbi:MAG: S-layer homology domain-containing protein [Bacillota bacterium]|nr:S-layer homology domain-containing protein [Bacillota bacterium]
MKSRSLRMIMALCLCFTLVFPTVALGAGTKDFSDTKGHWAVSEIGNLAAQGYINGYPDGTFKPDSFMTKAEFTTALIGCLDITPSTPTKNSFSDTKTHWARKYIEEAVARGILVPSESPNGFGPDQDILRSQATAMIVRALALKASSGTIQFTDRDDVERSLYRDHIKAAYDAGIIKGFSDGSFAPYREMTRAQVCTVLVKMLEVKGGTIKPIKPIVSGTVKDLAVGDELFNLNTTSLIFKSGFSEVPVTSLAVANDVLTVNSRYVYGLDRSTGNPDVVVGNTRYTSSRMTVNGTKLVVYPISRHIHSLQLDGYKYNADYINLYVKSQDKGLYLADMKVVDEYTVEVENQRYDLREDRISIEVNKKFYDITRIQLLPGQTDPRLKETDPVVFRGMSLSDISAIYVGRDTLDVDKIDDINFFIDGKRYNLSDVTIDASANISVGRNSFSPDDVIMAIDDWNYVIDEITYFKGKFIFDLKERHLMDLVYFNDSYIDQDDITIMKGITEYKFDDVLVVDRNILRIGGKNYDIRDEDIKCLVDNKLWDMERIDWNTRLNMVEITAKESKDTYWASQPKDYIFYDEKGRKIHQGVDDDVTLYLNKRWVTFDDVRIADPTTLTYSGRTYDMVGLRLNIDDDYYVIEETSWSSSGTLSIYLEDY